MQIFTSPASLFFFPSVFPWFIIKSTFVVGKSGFFNRKSGFFHWKLTFLSFLFFFFFVFFPPPPSASAQISLHAASLASLQNSSSSLITQHSSCLIKNPSFLINISHFYSPATVPNHLPCALCRIIFRRWPHTLSVLRHVTHLPACPFILKYHHV